MSESLNELLLQAKQATKVIEDILSELEHEEGGDAHWIRCNLNLAGALLAFQADKQDAILLLEALRYAEVVFLEIQARLPQPTQGECEQC